jgi:predicted DCC family thiol-disulfide oxidoreductase YuxK
MEPALHRPSAPAATPGRHLILYDGVCGLCNKWVGLVLPRDPQGIFHFAALQSETGQKFLRNAGKNPDVLDTIYVVMDYKSNSPQLVDRARAALFVIGSLESPWRFLRFLGILPKFLLDAGYSLVARSRYRLFGRYDQCALPPATHRTRFHE